MQETGFSGARPLVKIARVLVEDRRKDRLAQVAAGEAIGKRSRKALSVACGALPVSGKAIVRLLDARRCGNSEEIAGIEEIARFEREFLPCVQRRRIPDV